MQRPNGLQIRRKTMTEKKDIYYLDNWYMRMTGDGFTAPEMREHVVCGTVTKGEINTEDPVRRKKVEGFVGEEIMGGRIMGVQGREVHTPDSILKLGTIEGEYKEWLDSEGFTQHLNEDEPIAFGKRATRVQNGER